MEITLKVEGLPSGLTANHRPQKVTAKIGKKKTKSLMFPSRYQTNKLPQGGALSHVTFSEDKVSVTQRPGDF